MASDSQAMPRERDENSGKYRQTFTDEEFIEAIQASDGGAATTEIAEHVGCSYELAYKRLRSLEDAGIISKRKIGNANLWMD